MSCFTRSLGKLSTSASASSRSICLHVGDLALSVQVLQEFYVQSTRPSRLGALSHGEAVAFAESLARYPVQSITIDVMREAFALCERFSLSYWDAAILAAAMVAGCDAVYSEDMSSEQDYDGLRVINPFI